MQLKKAGCMSITARSRDEKRAVKEQTISVDRRSDSAADGRARKREKKKQKKIRDFGREQWSETKGGKKRAENGKTFLSRFPGLEILPSLFSLSPTTRSMTGLASLPWRLGLWLERQRRSPFERRARLARVTSQNKIILFSVSISIVRGWWAN